MIGQQRIKQHRVPPPTQAGCATQTGSALIEFILILGVLLPVGSGIAMLGKLTDLQQTTEQAGRYSAWEATVYSRQALRTQRMSAVDQRFFQSPNQAISSEVNREAPSAEKHPLWGAETIRTGSVRELSSVSRVANTTVKPNYTFDTGKAEASVLSGKAAATVGKAWSGFNGNSWGLVADGLLRTEVDVAVESTDLLHALHGQCGNVRADTASADATAATNKAKHVCVRAAGVILADGWSASGDSQAISRVRSLVPGSAATRIGKGVSTLLGSWVFPELDPLDKAFGHVDMSALPAYAKP